MNKLKLFLNTAFVASGFFLLLSCGLFKSSSSNVEGNSQNTGFIKNQLIAVVLSALELDQTVNSLSDAAKIKIDMPQPWPQVQHFANTAGLGESVKNIERNIDTITQDLGKAAFPYLKVAIEQMSLTEALTIVNGSSTSLSNYLRKTTGNEIETDLKPIVNNGLKDFGVMELWGKVIPKYNAAAPLTGKPKMETELDQYVAKESVDVIFKRIADKESEMRKNNVWKSNFSRK